MKRTIVISIKDNNLFFLYLKRNTNRLKWLDSLDYTIVDNNSQFLGIENLEMIRKYLLDERNVEYVHCEMFELPYNLEQIYYIIENNFKFNNDEIRAECFKWFVECITQDENEIC